MIAGIQAEYQSNARSTKDTPYLTLLGELWDVFCEYFLEDWPRYNGTTCIFIFHYHSLWNPKVLWTGSSTGTLSACSVWVELKPSRIRAPKPKMWTTLGFNPQWQKKPAFWTRGVVFARDWINSLTTGKFWRNFRYLIFQKISMIDGWGISGELVLRWMSLDLTDDKSILVQVMAWCHQATSHYLNRCWPKSLPPIWHH